MSDLDLIYGKKHTSPLPPQPEDKPKKEVLTSKQVRKQASKKDSTEAIKHVNTQTKAPEYSIDTKGRPTRKRLSRRRLPARRAA